MPEIAIEVTDAQPALHAMAPTLHFQLAIRQKAPSDDLAAPEPCPIQSITLQCQIRIDATKRIYKPAEQAALGDLFGEPSRWSQTLTSLLWTHASVNVPPFEGATSVALPVPCSFDFSLAATKYFHALEYGSAPLLLLFSGSVFYRNADGDLAMDLISWEQEAEYRLPVAVWQQMIEHYYPNEAWLRLNRRVFDALYAYKRQHGYTGFDQALSSLLQAAGEAPSVHEAEADKPGGGTEASSDKTPPAGLSTRLAEALRAAS